MVIQTQLTTRPVKTKDRNQLAHLIHFGTYVHRHLDWKPPLEWIGSSPFYVAESDGRVAAALACPPDPPGVAWIRMFVCSTRVSYQQAWKSLWTPASDILQSLETVELTAAIPLQKWFRELLLDTGFEHSHNVISLAWDPQPGKIAGLPKPQSYQIRKMVSDDLPAVYEIDSQSFNPLWQNATDSIRLAFQQAIYASVIVEDEEILSYQITTQTPYGAHLGRLATRKNQQGRGIGYSIMHDLVSQLNDLGVGRISVNTQDNNQTSRRLYHKVGFMETNEAYPVFIFKFD